MSRDAVTMLQSIQTQVMWNRLIAVVEEQAQALLRTAFGSVAREAGDLSAGVYDARGRMLAQAVTGTPGHVNTMATAVAHFLERFPPATMRAGDVYVTNDPWLGTGHLFDFVVVTPVFRAGRLTALFASTCHTIDVGGIGFSAEVKGKDEAKNVSQLLRELEPEDLVRYGLIPEFVGRLPVIATLEELDEPALIQILTEPKNSLTRQFKKLFDMEGVELDFREDGLRAIAGRALARKTGARGLRSILESVLLETMYEIPSERDVTKVVIDESVIKGDSAPLKVYESVQPKAAPGE